MHVKIHGLSEKYPAIKYKKTIASIEQWHVSLLQSISLEMSQHTYKISLISLTT